METEELKKALTDFNYPEEFDSADEPGSGVNMQPGSLLRLQKARTISAFPYTINSAYRTDKHNRAAGGVDDGAHEKGYAFDIKAKGSRARFRILKGLIEAGFTRIGIYKTFIHADDDPTLPQEVLWF